MDNPNPESRRATPGSQIPNPLFASLYKPPQPESPSTPLAAIARDFSPRFECHGGDVVTIDVSGLERLLGPARSIGEELRRDAASRGVRVHVAVAGTRMAAILLAHARPGVTIIAPGGEAEALAPIAIGILEKIAADHTIESALSTLKAWGLKTLGELAALPSSDLASRLGRQALVWQAIARGADARPLVPTLDEERFESSMELEWPIEGLEPLSFVLTRLLEPLSARLERRDRGVAVLHVLLRLVDTGSGAVDYVRRLELPTPMRDVRTLRTLALLDLESHPPSAAIDRVSIVIDPTPGRTLQHALFTRAQPTPEQVSTLLARLGALMGQDRFGAPTVVDSDRPGAFATAPFKLSWGGPCRTADAGPERPRATAIASQSLSAEPLTSVLRRCRQPVPARVAIDNGRPVRVTTDRRGFVGGSVVRCAGPWRTSGEWWATSPPASDAALPHAACVPRAFNRDEWDVALNDGAAYRIFQDRDTDAWFIDAIVD